MEMEDENLVSINLEELTNFLMELDSLNVKIEDEEVQTNLTEMNENLTVLNEYFIPSEDEPDLYLENLESINENLESVNDNLVILNETVQIQRTDEISDLEIKSYGSNIIILLLLIVYGLFKGISKIFGLANKAI